MVGVVFLDLLFSFDPGPGGAAMVGQSVNVCLSCMYLSMQGGVGDDREKKMRRRSRDKEEQKGKREGAIGRVSSRRDKEWGTATVYFVCVVGVV